MYLAIDQGGHASRALVFDSSGQLQAHATVPVATLRPAPDRVEHDPEALVQSVRDAVAAAAAQLGPQRHVLRAAGLATQRSSIVCWDRETGAALSPVLSWQDRRAARWLAGFAGEDARVRALTGLVLSPHYGASKMRWCLDQLPGLRRALARERLMCGPLASFLLARLTPEGTLHADPCNASRTLLWSLDSGDWSAELLALFGIPAEVLPPCGPNAATLGSLDVAGQTVPLAVCTGDQPAALFALGRPGEELALVNAGTGAFMLCGTGARLRRAPGLLTSLAWQDARERCYVLEGTVNGAGSALAWAADACGLDADAALAQLDRWSRRGAAPPLFLNGVSGLAAPYWVSDFPSRFVGAGGAEAKMVAVLESIVFLLLRNLARMRASGLAPTQLRLTGGLAASSHFAQSLADLSELPVQRPQTSEATATGLAFLLAGAPANWQPEVGEVPVIAPGDNPALAERYVRWCEALELALGGRATAPGAAG